MKTIVKMVEEQVSVRHGARPIRVRLKVSALSHLHDQDSTSMETVFSMASQGTLVEGAAIELIRVPVQGICPKCGHQGDSFDQTRSCPMCGSGAWKLEEQPEVVLHEVIVEE